VITKKYARTMQDAFPFGPEYGCAIEVSRPLFARTRSASLAVAVCLALAFVSALVL